MDRSIFVALSGAVVQEKRLEVLTDNLANVNTAGFKKQKPLFEDAMPDGYGIRDFASMDKVVTDMSQGPSEKTGRMLDLAIKGEGFFVMNTVNGPRYTRDGSFTLATDGTLTSREGFPVTGDKGVIKLTSPDVAIDAEGNIREKGAIVDRLKVVSFSNLMDLRREGNFFMPVEGAKETAVSKETAIDQGYVETSNVNAVRAMTTMIEAMRSFETHTKMIQTIDDMTKKAIEEVGRV
ncbi:MAG: flagellar basal-body rod protein FlgF [Deltaproteobacteria bacterium GWC2_56_8]|nr:MAG: flagellar basal-body rod protein FlgF [Deltaproteobacteria bacterium GWB2_55_19]OGP32972.1 MAG: flagellar basal-body rod protein FlgF [Deltaproteobacteria bacterium GWC2_56_8]HAO93647.1 flagellar basal-body rod protein FlgF [Deltaproteobacteria bacterium]